VNRAHALGGERGQTLLIFALAFALFLFGLICLVADGAVLFRWSARVEAAAQVAAQSGADSVSPGFLYGQSQPCPAPHAGRNCPVAIVDVEAQDRRGGLFAFQRACIQAGDQSAGVPRHAPNDLTPKVPDDPQTPEGTTCDSDGCHVSAVVTRAVRLPIPIPGFPDVVEVRGSFFAAPVVGATTPTGTCAGGAWVPAAPPSRAPH